MRRWWWTALLLWCCTALPVWASSAGSLNVFSAASLTDAMREISAAFEQRTGIHVDLNLAGSSTLRLQIEQGMPCDVFVSADTKNPARLLEGGFVLPGQQKAFLTNRLVVITAQERHPPLGSLKDLVRLTAAGEGLSLADPQTIPAGIYAREALTQSGVWPLLEGRVIPALDVRAAMAQVEGGSAAYGIVYRTDARMSTGVREIYDIPVSLHSPIAYVASILKDNEHAAGAEAFYAFLFSPSAQDIFQKYGFEVLQ